MSDRKPNPTDLYVAAKVKQARKDAKLTQTAAAAEIGVTTQQLSKAEAGINRITSGALFKLALVTRKPIGWFFPATSTGPEAELPAECGCNLQLTVDEHQSVAYLINLNQDH